MTLSQTGIFRNTKSFTAGASPASFFSQGGDRCFHVVLDRPAIPSGMTCNYHKRLSAVETEGAFSAVSWCSHCALLDFHSFAIFQWFFDQYQFDLVGIILLLLITSSIFNLVYYSQRLLNNMSALLNLIFSTVEILGPENSLLWAVVCASSSLCTPGLYLPGASTTPCLDVTIEIVSRHGQMSSGGATSRPVENQWSGLRLKKE